MFFYVFSETAAGKCIDDGVNSVVYVEQGVKEQRDLNFGLADVMEV